MSIAAAIEVRGVLLPLCVAPEVFPRSFVLLPNKDAEALCLDERSVYPDVALGRPSSRRSFAEAGRSIASARPRTFERLLNSAISPSAERQKGRVGSDQIRRMAALGAARSSSMAWGLCLLAAQGLALPPQWPTRQP